MIIFLLTLSLDSHLGSILSTFQNAVLAIWNLYPVRVTMSNSEKHASQLSSALFISNFFINRFGPTRHHDLLKIVYNTPATIPIFDTSRGCDAVEQGWGIQEGLHLRSILATLFLVHPGEENKEIMQVLEKVLLENTTLKGLDLSTLTLLTKSIQVTEDLDLLISKISFLANVITFPSRDDLKRISSNDLNDQIIGLRGALKKIRDTVMKTSKNAKSDAVAVTANHMVSELDSKLLLIQSSYIPNKLSSPKKQATLEQYLSPTKRTNLSPIKIPK